MTTIAQVIATAPAMSEAQWSEVQERLRAVHKAHAVVKAADGEPGEGERSGS